MHLIKYGHKEPIPARDKKWRLGTGSAIGAKSIKAELRARLKGLFRHNSTI